jgi:hypothetical protein
MAEVRNYLIQWQRQRKVELSSDQWSLVWRYYKLLRTELDRSTDAKQEGEARV